MSRRAHPIPATLRTLGGIALLAVAPHMALPILRASASLLALILILHFGLLELLTWRLQRRGYSVTPLMDHPMHSRSLAELWSRRWNSGFTTLSRRFIFKPLSTRTNPTFATFAVFVASGLVHDLVISVPARGGYGLPTLYFLLQFAGILLERTRSARHLFRASPVAGRLFTIAYALVPLPLLFHPMFVHNVIFPFVTLIHRSIL